MAQQQARRDDDQFKNLDRTDDQEIQDGDVGKNRDQVFGTTGGTATDPVAVYAYESSTVGGVPAAGGMPAADYRYEYTAVYETTTVPTAAPGFGVGAGGVGGGFGQQANADQGAAGGDKTGGNRNMNMNMNMSMDRDQK